MPFFILLFTLQIIKSGDVVILRKKLLTFAVLGALAGASLNGNAYAEEAAKAAEGAPAGAPAASAEAADTALPPPINR